VGVVHQLDHGTHVAGDLLGDLVFSASLRTSSATTAKPRP
jgi:hypothetical protein